MTGVVKQIHIIDIGDWTGLYIDGNLAYQGHLLEPYTLLTELKERGILPNVTFEVRYNDTIEDAMRYYSQSHLPESIEEVNEFVAQYVKEMEGKF